MTEFFPKNHCFRSQPALKSESCLGFFKLNLQMVKNIRDKSQALGLTEASRGEFCIFLACLLSSRRNFVLSASQSSIRTLCRSSDYIRDALQNSKYCRGHWEGKWFLQWNFNVLLMICVSFPQKGVFNNSFPIVWHLPYISAESKGIRESKTLHLASHAHHTT